LPSPTAYVRPSYGERTVRFVGDRLSRDGSRGLHVWEERYQPLIHLRLGAPVRFDPTAQTTEQLEQLAAEAGRALHDELVGRGVREGAAARQARAERKNVMEQGKRLRHMARRAGYRPIASEHGDDQLRRLALRLARRAVLGWTFERIAAAEFDECGVVIDGQTVAESVTAWARALNVPLNAPAPAAWQFPSAEN
jgi:hypothetical protein